MDDAEARRDFQRRFERMGRVFDEGPPPPGQLTVEDCAHENAEHEARGEHVIARPSPERDDAPADAVLRSVLDGVSALARGHFQTFAPKLRAHLADDPRVEARIARVRDNLPARMRQAERRRQAMLDGEPLAPLEGDAPPHPRADDDGRYDW